MKKQNSILRIYFPIQKLEKILSSRSSVVVSPTIVPKLETAIYQLIFSPEFSHQSLMLTNERQKQSAVESQKSIHSALQILEKKARRGNHC